MEDYIMFRSQTPDDISQEEYEKYVSPHMELVEEYLKTYLIPDYVAFFIFSAYRNQLEEDSYDIFISSALDFFNVDYDKKNRLILKDEITRILEIKYGFVIDKENPLTFK